MSILLWHGWTSVVLASGHTVRLIEVGTDLPVVAQITCGEQTGRSGVNGSITLDVVCETVQIISQHHYPVQLTKSEFLALSVIPLQPLSKQETVLIEEKRSPAHAQSYGLDAEDLERTPGSLDDPIRLIQSLPGTVATREYGPNAGSVILRGAAPSESRLYIDGVEVPYLYHFDQYASILPTKLVDNVLIYPSNFGTSYGDAIGGIVALESKEADGDEATVYAQANLIMAGVQATTPVSFKGQDAGVLLLVVGVPLPMCMNRAMNSTVCGQHFQIMCCGMTFATQRDIIFAGRHWDRWTNTVVIFMMPMTWILMNEVSIQT